jgi:hypothetical protein
VLTVVRSYESGAATLADGRIVPMNGPDGAFRQGIQEVLAEWGAEDETMTSATAPQMTPGAVRGQIREPIEQQLWRRRASWSSPPSSCGSISIRSCRAGARHCLSGITVPPELTVHAAGPLTRSRLSGSRARGTRAARARGS